MKVLNVMFTTRLGGLEQAFLDYTKALQIAQIDVISIIHSKSPLISKIEGNCYKVHNFSKYDPIALYKLRQIILQENPQAIITHGNRAHYMIMKVACNVPVIGVLHTLSFNHILKCDYVISVNSSMRDKLIEHGYFRDRVFHIPNMIEIPPNIVYKKPVIWNIPVIGLIARIEQAKGIDTFINALNILKERGIPFLAKIAGDGPDFEKFQNMISELHLDADIKMIGWIENKTKFYDEIDIICMPSRIESFGIVILEAYLNSKPIIVSDASGPLEIVNDGEDALVFGKENFHELADLTEKLILDQSLITKLTQNGFKKVKFYDINFISNSIINILKNIT